MSDYTVSKPIEMFGVERAFRALSGVVISTRQRSDTYVSGGGGSYVQGGYGGGSISVDSKVIVTSDIWIRGISGREYRLRFEKDIPVREGNIVHAIDIVDASGKDRISDGYVYLYNSATGEWFYTGGLNRKVRNIHSGRFLFNTFVIFLLLSLPLLFLVKPHDFYDSVSLFVSKHGLNVFVLSLISDSFYPRYPDISILVHEQSILDSIRFLRIFLTFPVFVFIVAMIIAFFRSYALFSTESIYKDYKKLDRIFESTFLSELDEIAKQFSKH